MRRHRSQARPRQRDRRDPAQHRDRLTPRTGRSFKSIATSRWSFRRTKTPDQVVLAVLFGAGLLSALLMNDTLAIIGTPLVLGIAARSRISPKLLLLTLAVAITTGSLASPVGNPQNLLVAVNGGIPSPFVTYLLVPTLISLLVAYLVLRVAYRGEFRPGHRRAGEGS